MDRFLLKLLLILCQISSILFGFLLFIISIIALIDPVGTKMADDGDPFGDPGGPWVAIVYIIVAFGLIFWPFVFYIYKYLKISLRTQC